MMSRRKSTCKHNAAHHVPHPTAHTHAHAQAHAHITHPHHICLDQVMTTVVARSDCKVSAGFMCVCVVVYRCTDIDCQYAVIDAKVWMDMRFTPIPMHPFSTPNKF